MPKLYCANILDISFGDGPLGIHLGKTDNGDVIVAGFTKRGDNDCFPIEVGIHCHLIKVIGIRID